MTASRIANVTAAIRVDCESEAATARGGRGGHAARVRDLAALCAELFEEVLRVGAEHSGEPIGRFVPWAGPPADRRSALEAALEAASSERVILVDPDGEVPIGAEALLALTAWPESSVVQPVSGDGTDLPWAIYRRAEGLERARLRAVDELEASAVEAWASGLEVERVPLATLGIEHLPRRPFDQDVAPGIAAVHDRGGEG